MDPVESVWHLHNMYFTLDQRLHVGEVRGTKPENKESWIQYDFASADEIISALGYESELYLRRLPLFSYTSEFVYRGQSDHKWRLVPSAYRDNEFDYHRRPSGSTQSSVFHVWGNIQQLEKQAFFKFILEANKLGYTIPPTIFNRALTENDGYRYANHPLQQDRILWLRSEDLELLALAQHYGIRTRLLDFTTNPLVALFFAAASFRDSNDSTKLTKLRQYQVTRISEGALQELNGEYLYGPTDLEYRDEFLREGLILKNDGFYSITEEGRTVLSKRIGVWCVPKVTVVAAEKLNKVRFVQVPNNQNANMNAQQALFIDYLPNEFPYSKAYVENGRKNVRQPGSVFPPTEDEIAEYHLLDLCRSNGTLKSLDAVLLPTDDPAQNMTYVDHSNKKKKTVTTNPYTDIYQKAGAPRLFTLPWHQCAELLTRLSFSGIDWTRLTPSLFGASHQVASDPRIMI